MQELNNVEELTPLIITANAAEFKNKLITPVNHEVFIACLKLALQNNAREIIKILSRCELSSRDEKRKLTKLIDPNAKTLLHLVSIEYAEMFHTKKKMQQLFLAMINTLKNKDAIFAAIKGETFYLKTIDAIPQLSPQLYHPIIVYAAANNQLDVVRYLHAQKENPHELDYHRNALVAAITCNASAVFDYLMTTEFDPNLSLSIDTRWPCKLSEDPTTHKLLTLSVVCNHPDQFIKLVKKGAVISKAIVNLAVKSGCDLIVLCCIENTPKLINSSLMLAATHAGQLTTLQILCDKTSILDTEPNTLQICLVAAIECGQALIVQFLLSKNISLDYVSKNGLTPLFYAIEHNKIDVVKELLAQKADILAVNERGENALLIACQSSEHLEILEYLLSIEKIAETLNSDIYNNKNLLTVLCKDLSISNQVLECLVKHGIALFKSIPIENSQERYFVFTYQDMDYTNFANILPLDHRSICVFYLNYC